MFGKNDVRQILEEYITHQERVITRRTRFELKRALREAHLYLGYKLALDNIDEVIHIIRQSPDTPTAKENLKARFAGDGTLDADLETVEGLLAFAGSDNPGMSEAQAQAIVTMPLGRLSGLERQKIEDRLSELNALVAELQGILADENKIRDIIREELLEVRRKFADERKTELIEAHDEILLEDLIERHKCIITMTRSGYVKRQRADDYTAQRRGGMGKAGLTMKEEDFTERVIVADSHSYLLLFTSRGKVFAKKAYQIPEASRTAKGTNIVNLLELETGESITAVISIADFDEDAYLLMVTEAGVIKRTALSEYAYQRKGGKIALNLDEGDRLIFVALTRGDADILLATADGQGSRFAETDVRVVGRTSRGVTGIRLRRGDRVVGAVIVENDEAWQETHHLVTITEKGIGKRVPLSNFRRKNRPNMGVRCQQINEKTGNLCGVAIVTEEEDLMMITDLGTLIRISAGDISLLKGSAATGVRVMRLAEGASIVSFAVADKVEEMEDAVDGDAPDENVSDAPADDGE